MSVETVKISSAELAAEYANCQTLGEVVVELEKKMRAQGRVVCNISVNGMRLSEADEHRLGGTSLHELRHVELEIEEPRELVLSTLHSQIQLSGELQRLSLSAAETFRGLDLNPAQAVLISLLDGCRWFTDGLVALKSAPSSLIELPFAPSQWDLSEAEFRRVMSEILAAVERRDYILLADLLEYDLGNALDRWRGLLTQITENSPKLAP